MVKPQTFTEVSEDTLLAEIADEFLTRLKRGEQPQIDDYAERHPEIANDVRQVLSTLQVMGAMTAELSSQHDSTEAEVPVGRRLGDFRIVREIGRGGMGVVYEAEQVSLDRRVALKVLPFAAVLDERQLQRFKNEAQAAGQLHHNNIVPVYSVGCERGVHYYAMQYVEGHTLAEVVRELRRLSEAEGDREQPGGGNGNGSVSRLAEDLTTGSLATVTQYARDSLPDKQAETNDKATSVLEAISNEGSTRSPAFFRSVASLGVQAAEALEHAHEMGIVHRDIKPSNLLLDGRGHLWMTDFGLAHCPVGTGMSLTMPGDLLGTIRYMSPEQAMGKGGLLDHRTDVYSLGVTLYEMLALEPAFTGQDRQELLHKIADEKPRPLRQLNEATPTDMETIVLKAMAKEPESRYATARDLSDDLQRFLADKPIKAKRPTLTQRMAKWSRRHRAVVWSGVLLLFMAVVALSISTILIWQEKSRTEAALVQVESQQKRAEGNLALALKALDEVYMAMVERLPEKVEVQEKDRELLQKALAFYEQFAQENQSAVEARYETAKAYMRVADIHHRLGEYEQAIEAHRDAHQAFEKLVDEFPRAADYRKELAESDINLSHSYLWLYRYEEAEQVLRRASNLAEKLVAEFGDVPAYRNVLAISYSRLGTVLAEKWDKGQGDEAEQSYRSAIAIQEELAREFPNVPEYRSVLSITYHNLAVLLKDIGELDEAEQNYRSALAIDEELAREFPDVPKYRLMLATTHSNLGDLLSGKGELDEAEQALRSARSAIVIEKELVREFPNLPAYRSRLAFSHRQMGDMLWGRGEFDESEHAYRSAIAIDEELAREFPNVPDYRSNLAASHQNMGDVLLGKGELDEAEQTFRSASEILKELVAELPEVSDYQMRLGASYNNLAWYFANCVDPQFRDAGRAVELAQKAVEAAPEHSKFWNTLGVALYRAGRWEDSIEALNKSMELNYSHASNFFFLAMAHWQQDNKEQANQWYNKAVEWMEQNQPKHEELCRFRAETEKLMGISDTGTPDATEVVPMKE